MSTLDHLVLACDDLARACATFESLTGVTPVEGGRHAGVGTRNAVVALGASAYIEIMAVDPDQDPPVRARPFRVGERAALGLAGWVVAPADIGATITRLRQLHHDPGNPVTMEREVSGGGSMRWRLATPRDWYGGVVPFLIDWQGSPTPASYAPKGCDLVRVTARHPDPARARALLAAVGVDIEVEAGRQECLTAVLVTPNGHVTISDPLAF